MNDEMRNIRRIVGQMEQGVEQPEVDQERPPGAPQHQGQVSSGEDTSAMEASSLPTEDEEIDDDPHQRHRYKTLRF